MAELPECPQYAENKCPKSDVRLMAEHGPPQMTWYTTFFCRTCRYLFVGHWNPLIVRLAKQGKLQPVGENLMSPRFRGIN